MTENSAEDDERFDEIIADYLDAVAAGQSVNEEQFIAEHPEFAEALRAFFADHHHVGGMLEPPDTDATLPPSKKTLPIAETPTQRGESTYSDLIAAHGADPDRCIADYLLLDRIAEGGMGVVYKARQLSLNRTVALKMIRAGEFADEEEIRRFRVEAEAAAKLTHPGIVPIYQIGEDKGQHFFSMAYVEGVSLADVIREQPMIKPRRAAEYVAKVARAVHFAHTQGVIHRDIKPANVLLDASNEPLVTDFGLAKQISADHELTMSGQILGTASYMPPEQAAGKAVTPLADVYSLGALLYALLTKQPPFSGANPVDILMDVLSKEPPTPSALNVTLSRDLETICMRCLEKSPDRRYASAEELADDLERFLDGTPILARPVGRIEKWVRWCQRRPAVATAILLAMMLCLAAAAYVVKDGERRIFAPLLAQRGDGRPLSELVRDHYQRNPLTAATQHEELLLVAVHAMLSVEGKLGEVTRDDAAFVNLAQRLELQVQQDPTNDACKSALADCLFQLAQFRFPKAGATVPEADAMVVTSWLERSTELLSELVERYPDSQVLRERKTAVQSAFFRLPLSLEEHKTRWTESKPSEASLAWEQPFGIVRFDWQAEVREGYASESLSRLKRRAKEGSQSARCALAEAYAASGRVPEALHELEVVLNDQTLTPAQVRNAFISLYHLWAREPVAVQAAMTDVWPQDVERLYQAVLGIRSAASGYR